MIAKHTVELLSGCAVLNCALACINCTCVQDWFHIEYGALAPTAISTDETTESSA
jgi:hypothetical protein